MQMSNTRAHLLQSVLKSAVDEIAFFEKIANTFRGLFLIKNHSEVDSQENLAIWAYSF